MRFPIKMRAVGKKLELSARFSRKWINIVKSQFGHPHWCGMDEPPRKAVWSVDNDVRAHFRLAFLQGKNPYANYDAPLGDWESEFPLMPHQYDSAAHLYYRRRSVLAGEMGTGKTLSFLDVARRVIQKYNITDTESMVWYVSMRSPIRSVLREIEKWNFEYPIRVFTYNKLVTEIKNWPPGQPAPRVLIIDESHFVKTPDSQRTSACRHVSQSMLEEYGAESWVMLATGTPAPLNPADWWSQCEIACPGYLSEGSRQALVRRLSITKLEESATGGAFPRHITWLDDENKCAVCGQLRDGLQHQTTVFDPITMEDIPNTDPEAHNFIPSKNEISFLYQRLKGLVLVQFKADCLDLPDKSYEIIRAKPTPDSIRTMATIKRTSPRAITALIKLRELSDGFQYTDKEVGKTHCPNCFGLKEIEQFTGEGDAKAKMPCDCCSGSGEVPLFERATEMAHCAKDDTLMELVEEFEETGRIVIWAGFTGSIDKLVNMLVKADWAVLRYDAQVSVHNTDASVEALLSAMDSSHPRRAELQARYQKVAFIGNPLAGGTGLTLTASPVAIYYSNPFRADARIQSEDRIHRAGMDTNRACRIIDLFNLPTDELVYNSLREKRDLQTLTMKELEDFLDGKSND
jgi:SNF2 family DNA or RNA helicase